MINSFEYSMRLESAGFTRNQAETTVGVFMNFIESNLSTKDELKEFRFVMRSDFESFRTEMRNKFDMFKTEIRHEIKELEYRMTIKLGVMLTVSLSLLFAALKLF